MNRLHNRTPSHNQILTSETILPLAARRVAIRYRVPARLAQTIADLAGMGVRHEH